MKNAVNLKSFPLLIIAALFVAFVIHPELRLSDLHAAVPFSSTGPTIKSEAQVKSEAARYDDAILQIKQIANLKLAVPEESKKAQGILDKQIPNLRFNRSKLIAFGLNDPGFVGAVKAKAGDKKSAEQFALELGKDHNAILKLPGAQSVSSSIRSSIEADTALLRRIAQLLKDAAVEIKAKSGHVMSRPTSSMPGSKHMSAARVAANPVVITDTLSPEVTTLLVVAAAVVICPPLGVAIFELANVAGVVLFTAAYISVLFAIMSAGQSVEQTQACEDKAQQRCDRCKADASKLFFPLNIAAADLCDAELLLEVAACLATGGLV